MPAKRSAHAQLLCLPAPFSAKLPGADLGFELGPWRLRRFGLAALEAQVDIGSHGAGLLLRNRPLRASQGSVPLGADQVLRLVFLRSVDRPLPWRRSTFCAGRINAHFEKFLFPESSCFENVLPFERVLSGHLWYNSSKDRPCNPAPPADAEALLTVGALRPLVASRNDGGLQWAHAEAPSVGRFARGVTMELLWAVIGAFAGLLLTLFVQPFIEGATQGFLVRSFGSTQRKKQSLAGTWYQQWHVESQNFPATNRSQVEMKQLGKRVSAKFDSGGRTYIVNGEVSQGTHLTGTWYDETEGATYHGAFQLRIHPKVDSMTGKWVGFSESGEIKDGAWEWQRSQDLPAAFAPKAANPGHQADG